MVDFSHGNSSKQYQQQMLVGEDIASQISAGNSGIMGVMIESHLKEGRQDCVPDAELEYGKSITDACISWETTVPLDHLAAAVRQRREHKVKASA